MYLNFGASIMEACNDLIRLNLVWLQQPKLVEILNLVLQKQCHFTEMPNSWSLKFIFSQTGKLTFDIFLLILAALAIRVEATANYSVIVGIDQVNFFLGNETSSTFSNLLAAATGVGKFYNTVIGFYNETYMLLMAITLWLPSKIFAEKLQRDIRHLTQPLPDNRVRGPRIVNATQTSTPSVQWDSWCEVREKYQYILEVSSMVNNLFGPFVFSFILLTILYESTNVHLLFRNNGPPESLIETSLLEATFLVIACGGFALAADVTKQVGSMTSIAYEY